MRDRNHERILLRKQVYCRYKDKGCEWQGTLREANRHCSTRLHCEWCNLKLLCYEVEQHNTVCVVANEIIKCELHSFGCLETFPRMSIQAHMQSNCREHVNLLRQAYEDLSSMIAALQNENAKLEQNKARMSELMDDELIKLKGQYKDILDNQQAIKEAEAMRATSQLKEWQYLKEEVEKMIIANSDVTLFGRINELSIERDEITEKLNDSRVEVKSLHHKIRRYKIVAIAIFFASLLVGIILQHFIPMLFDMTVQLLVFGAMMALLFYCYLLASR